MLRIAAQPESNPTPAEPRAVGRRVRGIAEQATVWKQWTAAWAAAEAWEFEWTEEEGAIFFALYSRLIREGVRFDARFNEEMRRLKQFSSECNGNNDC